MLQSGQWANLLKYEIAPEPNQDTQKPRTASKVKVARNYVKTNPEVDFLHSTYVSAVQSLRL